jgi:hypothetical protein
MLMSVNRFRTPEQAVAERCHGRHGNYWQLIAFSSEISKPSRNSDADHSHRRH